MAAIIHSIGHKPFVTDATRLMLGLICFWGFPSLKALESKPEKILERYCFDCHDELSQKGNFDVVDFLKHNKPDGSLLFENLITGKMPPAGKEQPSQEERRSVLDWLAKREAEHAPVSFRRKSRQEFVFSVNDLLGTKLELADDIPEDRGTYDFDSDRRIKLSREVLSAYFSVVDEMLDNALPVEGIPTERVWQTNKVKDSHESYRCYLKPHDEGILFSWTRANNGNNYSFFYDNFEPPVPGWYDLTFDALKVGEFEEDVSLQVYAGRYYFADDRPQPQRLLGVISLGNRSLASHSLRVFLNPGENVSVHCYSKHTFRQKSPEQGAYIKQLRVRGPVFDRWPPRPYQQVFGALALDSKVLSSDDEMPSRSRVALASRSKDDLRRILQRFAERAFASDLTEDELAPYIRVSLRHFKEGEDFVQVIKGGLKAILCSPRFLMAPGEQRTVADSMAADLARILWLSVPDEENRLLANRAAISDDTLRELIDRMIDDERSARMIRSFCDQWLNLRSLEQIAPSLKLYPRYNDLLDYYFPLETHAYLGYLIRENLPVRYLIDSDFSFLNQSLAQHYGINGVVGQSMRKVSFSEKVPRGGLLTMGSVLKVTTDGYDTSPILRGAWVSKNIVGTPLSPPPENVAAIEPAHGEAFTLREQIELHKDNRSCYACHKSIDPYGFALENFDASGQWRERYRVKQAHKATFIYRMEGYYRLGGTVDASGEVNQRPFENVFGLKKILASDQRKIAYNVAKKFFEYVNGYSARLEQRLELLDRIAAGVKGYRMKDLITEVIVYSLHEGRK